MREAALQGAPALLPGRASARLTPNPADKGIGLELGGAVAINLCAAVVLVAWLWGGSLELTVLGGFLLWTLAALLVGLSLVELYVQMRCSRR